MTMAMASPPSPNFAKTRIALIISLILSVGCVHSAPGSRIKSPCAITRNIKSNLPIIRVVDGLNDEPGVILGQQGLQYYTLISSRIQREVVIECSSAHGPVKWLYKGVGASSGFKVVPTRWTTSDISRPPTCFSSALVISHVTDQLTGEYKCLEVNSTRAKGPKRNSFKLFVPSITPVYPKHGSEVNITVAMVSSEGDQDKPSKGTVVVPCISKKGEAGGGVSLFRIGGDDGGDSTTASPVQYKDMRYDPFTGFIFPQNGIVFGNDSRVLRHECRFKSTDKMFLRVNLVLESEEKIAPEKDIVRASSPYLSWTTKSNPKLRFTPDILPNVLIWQQFFTKKGFEEVSPSAPMYYLGSATLMNLTYGKEGEIALLDGAKLTSEGDEQVIYKWRYFILDALAEQRAGMKHEDFEYFHVFICKSGSEMKPNITLKEVEGHYQEDIDSPKNMTGYFNVTDCPQEVADDGTNSQVGCIMLTSYIPQGEVTCVGDGVEETIRYPPLPFEAGRPFFVERGSHFKLTLPSDTEKLRIPCLTNSEVSTSVYLYKKGETGAFKRIWSEDDEDFVESEIEFYPSSGFHLTQTGSGETQNLYGEYRCSSSVDPEDTSDIVSVLVRKEIGTNFRIFPNEERVFGRTPFKFTWEADEDLELVSTTTPLRNITMGKEAENDNNPRYGSGVVIIMDTVPLGESRNLTLRKKIDGMVLHNWVFTQIDRNAEHRAGFFIETREDHDKGESLIVVRCRSKTNVKPKIRYYHCQNEETCELNLMRKCHQKDCHNPSFFHEDGSRFDHLIGDCEEGQGCSGMVIRSLLVNGLLNVSCTGDGVNEYRVLKDVFFKDDIIRYPATADDEDDLKDDDYIYLSTTTHGVHSVDQNPQREIQYIGANLEWELGETVEFSCVAAPFIYSNGIKWAVETKDGRLVYQKDSAFDIQFKYIGSTQVASTFSLLVDNPDYSRLYCFVPKLGGGQQAWGNASMPIFVKSETSDDYCHESNSIHLINVYPSPSKLKTEVNETRLDRLKYFVVPEDVLQLGLKVNGMKPFTWVFSGSNSGGDGPSRTPLIQEDRQVLDFYDSSTYCYSSRLLINLRHKTPNDTGRYIVKHKYSSKELASFYIFVPSKMSPYLLGSGSPLNISLPEDENDSYYIPCLVNNPEVKVELRLISTEEGELDLTDVMYDPTRGFFMEGGNRYFNSSDGNATEGESDPQSSLRMYKCIANGDENDYLIVYANPPIRTPELKYEKVNDFHVFTCRSGSEAVPPEITLTELGDDGTPVENTTEHKTARCSTSCVTLITQVPQGSITCKGEGIDETYRFPPAFSDKIRNSDKSVGLWYDNSTNTFKCQMNSATPPTLAAVTCRRPNECEIMKRLLQFRGDMSQATYSSCGEGCAQLEVKTREMSYSPPNWFSIFLRCKGEDNMEILSQFFYDKGIMTYATMEQAETLKRIRIDVPALRKQGNRVFATFRCFANRYFYSRGFQWGLEGRNGILEFPAAPASQIEVQSFSAIMSTINLEIDEGIHTAVYCFVPLLDSAAWANSTLKFPIDQLQVNI